MLDNSDVYAIAPGLVTKGLDVGRLVTVGAMNRGTQKVITKVKKTLRANGGRRPCCNLLGGSPRRLAPFLAGWREIRPFREKAKGGCPKARLLKRRPMNGGRRDRGMIRDRLGAGGAGGSFSASRVGVTIA